MKPLYSGEKGRTSFGKKVLKGTPLTSWKGLPHHIHRGEVYLTYFRNREGASKKRDVTYSSFLGGASSKRRGFNLSGRNRIEKGKRCISLTIGRKRWARLLFPRRGHWTGYHPFSLTSLPEKEKSFYSKCLWP